MKFRIFSVFLAALIFASPFAKSEVVKETGVYNIVETDTLKYDRYYSAEKQTASTLIFAFGGSFKAGERDNKDYVPFFNFLAENGINVVSIDYRTALADAPASQMASIDGFKAALQQAITVAVMDFLSATGYVISMSEEWGIDPTKIFACGSSAGAITALQAENVLISDSLGGIFPEWFNYAGVISLAGAVCADGEPVWTSKTAPLMLFHGDADNVVPYEKAVIGTMGLYGSKTISRQLNDMDIPHVFHTVMGASHEVCINPMNIYRAEILQFMSDAANGGVGEITILSSRKPGVKDYKTDFTIMDYLKSNM